MSEPRRVLVVGGTGAFGGAVVERLRSDGHEVVLTGRNVDRGSELAQRTGARFVPADLRESGAAEAVVAAAETELGGLDGLVLAAGVLHRATISVTSDAAWDTVMETNLIAPFLLARAALDALEASGGSIVVIASALADWPEAELGAYSVSKRALLWLTQMLAVEGATRNIRANAVNPGHTTAGMTTIAEPSNSSVTPPEAPTPPLPPSGSHTTPAEVAEAVAYLLSHAAAGSTGATLTVDGGLTAALRAVKVRQ